MNAFNDVGLSKHQKVVVAFEVAGPIFKTFSPVIGFFKLMALDHGSHSAVNDQDSFLKALLYCFHAALLLFSIAVFVDEQGRSNGNIGPDVSIRTLLATTK